MLKKIFGHLNFATLPFYCGFTMGLRPKMDLVGKNSHFLEIERFFDNSKSIVLLKVGTRFVRSGFG